ncbi:MAG TPA: (Fe-S)-binding protein [Candidatus Dormibacteraeota bacterium]|nr:(Fe-S)-binding protein [Candidatus Dormibacteraeota bacterium]
MTASASGLAGEQALAAHRCAMCPKLCRGACPTLEITGNERHQPWGHAAGAVVAMSRPQGFATSAAIENAFACATCSACTPPCKVDGVETPDLTWAVRAAVFEAGATPEIGLQAVGQAKAGRVPVGVDPPAWGDPAPLLAQLRALATPEAPLLLFPGCGALGMRPGAVTAAGRVLAAAGVAFDVVAEHRCCGMPALTFGDMASVHDMLSEVASLVQRHAATRLAVQSPSCAFLLGVRAPAMGLDIPAAVEPTQRTLAAAARALAPSSPAAAVAYHDPCYLSRHQSVVDEPRAALRSAGYEVRELRGRGATTKCSGRGGGLPLTHPEIARGYLRRLSGDVAEAGVSTVVTGCGSCAAALDGAVAGVAVHELAEALAATIEAG